MKTFLLHTVLSLIAFTFSVTGDKCNRPPEQGMQCTDLVTVQDFSGLDGCGLLLVKEDGTRLLATNLKEFVSNPGSGDVMRISYEEAPGMVSICMAEKMIVRISCLEVITKGEDCPVIIDPYRVEWAKKIMEELDPYQVNVARLDDKVVYQFLSKEEGRVYSCTGDRLCRYAHAERDVCREILSNLKDVKTIYVMNEKE